MLTLRTLFDFPVAKEGVSSSLTKRLLIIIVSYACCFRSNDLSELQ